MRKVGYSIPEISKELAISKSTTLRYAGKVRILPRYKPSYLEKRGGSKKRRLRLEQEAYDNARQLVGNLTPRDLLLFSAALYWAEGSKRDFSFSNTDPNLVKTFITGLRLLFSIPKEDFRMSIRTYEDLDKEKCIAYWSQVTNLPKQQFISVNVLSGKKKGKLEYGMCRVRICKGGNTLKRIKGINKCMIDSLENLERMTAIQ